MPYTIYILPEGDMTITGAVLDGVTQGDGSHMVGATITLNSGAWQAVDINDNDTDFQDSDSSQTLASAISIDSVPFSAGSVVEAEYSLTVTDGTNTWTVVAFNVNNSSPAYGTVEALAFIGPVGGFPPVNTTLTVLAAQEGPVFAATDYATPVCFVAGTQIAVPGGTATVEDLRPGDQVLTRDHGAQTLRWIGSREVAAQGAFAPIEFAPGTVGNSRTLRLSRQHRLRYSGWKAELLFGEEAVLIPAAHFENGTSIRRVEGGTVRYLHLLFDSHEVIYAEGAEAESFHPSVDNLAGLSRAARVELLRLFPEFGAGRGVFGPLIHRPLRAPEAAALLAC